MEYLQGINRYQLSFGCLEEAIETNNPVRFIEAFAEKLDRCRLGYVVKEIKSEGRPSFNPYAAAR